MSGDKLWIASFDIGKVNFAFYIEEINKNHLDSIINIPKNKRYNIDGTCTDIFNTTLNQILLNGKKILLKNVNLTSNTKKEKYFDIELCYNLNDLLDQYSEYWDNVSYFIIEQQMSFGKKVNTMALKLGQHCESYFIFKYGRFKKIVEFPSYYKTQVLGAKKEEKKLKSGKIKYTAVDKTSRKKWAIEKALYILSERNDMITFSEIINSKKKDDLADVICQLQAWKYLFFIEKLDI